jgi:uncharacterized protein (DUF58 family)
VDRARHPRARTRAALGALGRRIRRALRPPRTLRPTRAGWIFFALTFGVGFAALNTGNNLLYLVLSFMLSFLILSGVLSESALRGVSVRRRLPRELFADQPAPVALEVSNTQRRVPAFALVVEDLAAGSRPDEMGPSLGRVFVLRVGPEATETRVYALAAEARGPLWLGGFRVSTRFPFGLFSKALLLEQPQQALVYPAVDRGSVRPPNAGDRRPGETSRTARGAGTEVEGLRAYATGDPHRRVDWRASLRSGELLVRDTASERNARVEVRLATRGAPGPGFEHAVRRAASEVVAFLDAGLRVALRTDGPRIEAGDGRRHRARLLSFLARVQAGEPA